MCKLTFIEIIIAVFLDKVLLFFLFCFLGFFFFFFFFFSYFFQPNYIDNSSSSVPTATPSLQTWSPNNIYMWLEFLHLNSILNH